MKGLLLKDLYMIRKYCRSYLLIIAVFILVSVASDQNFFFIFYPCLMSGMIPVTLLGYDERSKWSLYCGALPYTKTQIVSGKYLVGLFAQLAVIILSTLAQAVRMYLQGTFDVREYLALMEMVLILSCFSASISLPFIFKYGVEKGRIAYYIMIGVVCGGSVAAAGVFETMQTVEISAGAVMPVLCVAAVAVYALSWYLSIVFYEKREV